MSAIQDVATRQGYLSGARHGRFQNAPPSGARITVFTKLPPDYDPSGSTLPKRIGRPIMKSSRMALRVAWRVAM